MPHKLKGKNVLITVSGPDHPGITCKLLEHISAGNHRIIDMGQSVTHGLLSLSIVIRIDEQSGGEVIKDLLFSANEMGLNLEYKVVEESFHHTDSAQENYILNCVSVEEITPNFLKAVSNILATNDINIKRIDKISPHGFKSLEIAATVPTELNPRQIKEDLMMASTEHQVDVAFLKDNIFRRSKRLIAFDMDSTLIQTEVIDEMADLCGVGDEIREITERAMNGELDFDQSLIQRVSKLQGLEVSKMEDLFDRLPFTPGVFEFVSTVKKLGYKVAIISGGFTFFADRIKEKLGLDYAFANELEIVDGKLTGGVVGTIINAEQKAMLLKVIAQQENISLEQVVAVGDGANDLPMLGTAGLGIAFHAKDIVKKNAPHHMGHGPMTTILYFLGIPDTLN